MCVCDSGGHHVPVVPLLPMTKLDATSNDSGQKHSLHPRILFFRTTNSKDQTRKKEKGMDSDEKCQPKTQMSGKSLTGPENDAAMNVDGG